jgi:hypothetical protein
VSQLILLTEAHEKGNANIPSNMVPFAENVLRASESLIEHAQRNADFSNDQVNFHHVLYPGFPREGKVLEISKKCQGN